MSDAKRYARAVAALDAIDGIDNEAAHRDADEIVLALLPPDVREAYQDVKARCTWWMTA